MRLGSIFAKSLHERVTLEIHLKRTCFVQMTVISCSKSHNFFFYLNPSNCFCIESILLIFVISVDLMKAWPGMERVSLLSSSTASGGEEPGFAEVVSLN